MGKSLIISHHEALVAHAEGWLNHLNRGLCPDPIEGRETRDTECRVCQALIATPTTLSTAKPPRELRTKLEDR